MWVRLDAVVAQVLEKVAEAEAPAQFQGGVHTRHPGSGRPKAATACPDHLIEALPLDRRMQALNARIRLWRGARTGREEAPRPGRAARPREGETSGNHAVTSTKSFGVTSPLVTS